MAFRAEQQRRRRRRRRRCEVINNNSSKQRTYKHCEYTQELATKEAAPSPASSKGQAKATEPTRRRVAMQIESVVVRRFAQAGRQGWSKALLPNPISGGQHLSVKNQQKRCNNVLIRQPFTRLHSSCCSILSASCARMSFLLLLLLFLLSPIVGDWR